MTRFHSWMSTLAVASLLAAGCSDDPTRPSTDSLVGDYELVAVDGRDLPASPVRWPDYRVLSGELQLNADGTFSQVIEFINPDGLQIVDVESGTYRVWDEGASSSIMLTHDDDGFVSTGPASGEEVELWGFGIELYRRR